MGHFAQKTKVSHYLILFTNVIYTLYNTYILIHRFAHQSVHDELTELLAIVALNGICQTYHHFKIVHVYVPVRMMGEQAE